MKKIILILATLLQWPLMIIIIVFKYISEAFNQVCMWSCCLLAKMFEYSERYQVALEWIKTAQRLNKSG